MLGIDEKSTLLKLVKRRLKITWENENTEEELTSMIEDADAYMDHLLGAEIDYSAPGIFRKLFLNYSMYSYNHCEDEFEDAYRKDILKCRAIVEVKRFEENAEHESE